MDSQTIKGIGSQSNFPHRKNSEEDILSKNETNKKNPYYFWYS